MNVRKLGNSSLDLTAMGIGAWAMGGGGCSLSAGPQSDQDSIGAIHRALGDGINWIDTAPLYGLGHSEEVVGRAIRGRATRPYVLTKCGYEWDSRGNVSLSLKARAVRRGVEASLRRLQIDAIDLCQIHQPRPDAELEEGWETLSRLQSEGLIRYIGVSNFSVPAMRRVGKIAPITSLQPPYSLVSRDIEDYVLPYAEAHNIGVLVFSPMQSGLLSGGMTRERIAKFPKDDSRAGYAHFREPLLSRNLALADLLREVGKRHSCGAGAVAVAWTLRHPAVTGAIVGVRTPAQVDGLMAAARLRLDEAEVREIESFVERTTRRQPVMFRSIPQAVRRLLRARA